MKENELMVGDWVLINDTQLQIQIIDGIDGEIMAGDELYCLIEDRVHSEDKVEPIPLTAEILEKNGFKDDGASWWYKDFHISLSVTKNLTLICGRTIQFSFVHELQHALRLCGLNELADNFIV